MFFHIEQKFQLWPSELWRQAQKLVLGGDMHSEILQYFQGKRRYKDSRYDNLIQFSISDVGALDTISKSDMIFFFFLRHSAILSKSEVPFQKMVSFWVIS